MAISEIVRPVWTSDDGTMAQDTARTRWHRIIENILDSIRSSLIENALSSQEQAEVLSSQQRTEAADIQNQLRTLHQEIVSNKKLPPIELHGDPDEQWFNQYLEASSQLSWQAAPWLFAECYLYRRVQALFAGSTFWRGYDVFKDQKDSTFTRSPAAVQDLAARYIANVRQCHQPDDSDLLRFKEFSDMMQVALWGNATDLSLLNRPTLEDLQSLQKQSSAAMVVDDDLDQLWSYLNSSAYQASSRNVDIVLDNAGFELFTDLVLAMYLLDQGIARRVTLHTKAFPWFVSDATLGDINTLMTVLRSKDFFAQREALDPLCDRLAALFSEGKISTTQHWFWTTGSAFPEMPSRAMDLFRDLVGRDLVIFKGDLNYRKLTSDGLWPHTTPFKTALGPLGAGSGMKILALRTNKADVCVGLNSEDQIRRLDDICPKGGWLRNGKYGVISFSDGK